tara:strand:+ start:440 stop:754 length:315 start_codon:yes stop_codon:yes gene_type:complete
MKPKIPLKKLLRDYYVNQNNDTEKKLKRFVIDHNLSIPDVNLTKAVRYLKSQHLEPTEQIIARAHTIAIGEMRNIIKMGGKKPTKRRRKKTIRRPTKKEDKSIL